VPIIALLRGHLAGHPIRGGRPGKQRVFGATDTQPFNGEKLSERADEV